MSTVKPLDEGETFSIGELRIVSRVQGGQSGGELELYEAFCHRLSRPSHLDETLCVIEGQVEFKVSETGRLSCLRATSRASRFQQPRLGSRPRVCSVHARAGSQHEYFRRLEELLAAPRLDQQAVQQLQKQYDQELVPLDS